MNNKVSAIIQARTNSSRFPNKIFKKIQNKTILEHVITQVSNSKLIDEIIIATTNSKNDQSIVKFCKKNKIKFFRGSSNDLLDRYFKCAIKNSCQTIVRITSDCPLIDPNIIDKAIKKFQKNDFDYVSNNIEFINGMWKNSTCNFPQGMTVEISNMKTLKKAWKNAKKYSEREHVFPYVQFNPKLFKISNIKYRYNYDNIRCTIDRIDDLKFLKQTYEYLPNKTSIHITDILKVIKKYPDLLKINSHIDFEEGYLISVKKDETSKMQKIFFLVDGNNKIGLGHVHRMINLAHEIKKLNKNIIFLTNDVLVKKIISSNFLCHIIQKNKKQFNLITKNDLVIVDKHNEPKNNLLFFKKNSKILIGIDYIGKGKTHFSKGINILYPKSGITGKKSYSGFKYSILNENFKNVKPIKIKKIPKSIVLLQGGTDSNCFTPKIINSILQLNLKLKITIIGNLSKKCESNVKKIIQKHPKQIIFKKNVSSIHNEFVKHDLAITGAAMTMLELASLGIPSIIICTEKFETETANLLTKLKYGINLGYQTNVSDKRIKNTLSVLFQNYKLRAKMNEYGPKIIDCKGTSRISNLIRGWL
jgi:spore coat polysaccharide biosynthesis protein SpsF